MAKYDLVLVGVTGFTGKLCLQYLLETPPVSDGKPVKFAVCARNATKVQQLVEELKGELNMPNAEVPIVVSDLVFNEGEDFSALADIVKSTQVVISCAGPFIRYSKLLTKLCAENGVDYADISGETDYMRQLIDTIDDTARTNKARITMHCGHDSVPWDISFANFALQIKKDSPSSVMTSMRAYVEAKGHVSGGTIETAYELMSRKKFESSLGFDPLLKKPVLDAAGSPVKSDCVVKQGNDSMLSSKWNSEIEGYTRNWPMAPVNGCCVKRTNVLRDFTPKLEYQDLSLFANDLNTIQGFGASIGLASVGLSFYVPPLKWAIRKWALPAPGEGPSKEVMDAGWLTLKAFADNDKGETWVSELKFFTDAGYRDTARMLVETGLSLLDTRGKKAGKDMVYGIVTAGAAVPEVLLKRLCTEGKSTYECKRVDSK